MSPINPDSVTSHEREALGAVAQKMLDVDYNGDISPYTDQIVEILAGVVAGNPQLREVVEGFKEQATRWNIAAWAEDPAAKLSDGPWHQFAERLEELI